MTTKATADQDRETGPAAENLGLAERSFADLVLRLINIENAKERLHFKYVSPEWLGDPGWYFWPKDRRGVYFLRLETALPDDAGVEAGFALHYYPHPEEEVFTRYSFLEQLARASDLFSSARPQAAGACCCHEDRTPSNYADLHDGLGIPVPEKRAELKHWLYRVGTVACRWENGQPKRFKAEAPSRSCTWACEKITVPAENGNDFTLIDKRELDRDVPAWELCLSFSLNFLNDISLLNIKRILAGCFLAADSHRFNNIDFALVAPAS